ncbi:MAG TPA: PHP domain-containing protein [Candidatus Absconditabacterales bacterium]|nr:PHP domain-containing protein [Candidatus Absconditabacterales bacterium]HMT26859.1 PHP domain-containing protein [Candidatus Absconditabacterales bacterium]
MYIPLHGHSSFSLLEAIAKIGKVVEKAKEFGMTAVGFTDYNGLYGSIDFYDYCKKAGIKPILGIEIPLVQDFSQKISSPGTVCILAKNDEGYANLIKLVSAANTIGSENGAKIDRATLKEYAAGLMVFLGGEKSLIAKMLETNAEQKKIQDTIQQIINSIGKENFFLEINAQNENNLPNIKTINEITLNLGEKLDIPVFVGNNYHYIKPDEKEAFEMALAIKDGLKLYDDQRRKVVGDYHFCDENNIITVMKKNNYSDEQIKKRIDQTQIIADQINLSINLGATYFPKYQTPDRIEKLYNQQKEKLIIEG